MLQSKEKITKDNSEETAARVSNKGFCLRFEAKKSVSLHMCYDNVPLTRKGRPQKKETAVVVNGRH